MNRKNAFIIPLTLMLVSLATILITAMYRRGSLFVPFMITMYQKEQAKMLALSGIEIAKSQLAYMPKKKEEKKEGPSVQNDASFFGYIFPKIGQWQEFLLKKSIDGIEGSIQIALSSEEGKINLNALYDFAKKKFVGEGQLNGDWKKIMQQLLGRIQKKMGIFSSLFEGFEKFMKQRQYKVNDASELLTIDAFRPFASRRFYEPAAKKLKEQPLYLFDLFTTYGYEKIQPWLLSDSLRGVLDMKRATQKISRELSQTLAQRFKPNIVIGRDWNILLQPLYGVEFQRLIKGIDVVFDTTFDPKLFSVVSYGKVGNVTVRAYAVLERLYRVVKQKSWYDITIKKFYWI